VVFRLKMQRYTPCHIEVAARSMHIWKIENECRVAHALRVIWKMFYGPGCVQYCISRLWLTKNLSLFLAACIACIKVLARIITEFYSAAWRQFQGFQHVAQKRELKSLCGRFLLGNNFKTPCPNRKVPFPQVRLLSRSGQNFANRSCW